VSSGSGLAGVRSGEDGGTEEWCRNWREERSHVDDTPLSRGNSIAHFTRETFSNLNGMYYVLCEMSTYEASTLNSYGLIQTREPFSNSNDMY